MFLNRGGIYEIYIYRESVKGVDFESQMNLKRKHIIK